MVTTNIGVEVTTGLRTGPSNAGTPTGVLQIAGLTEHGPVATSTLITSLAQYLVVYGGRTPYSSNMLDTARLFFEEGGSELLISRVVGPAATRGALELLDTLDAPTVKIEAKHPGSYSKAISVKVENAESTFTLTVMFDGQTVGVYRNMASISELVQRSATSAYINVVDMGSASGAPANNPAALPATTLPLGSDDRENVVAEHVIKALETAQDAAAGGAVAAPGYTADIIGNALIDYAKRSGTIALLSAHEEASVPEAIALAADLSMNTVGAYGGLIYPHMVITDGSGTRTVSPEGYAAAVRSRAFLENGFWQVPAGDRALTRWATGTNRAVTPEMNNQLSAGFVNGIVTSSSRVRLYNWTSLSDDRENLALLSARDVLNNLTVQMKAALEPFVFSTLDGRGQLLSQVEAAAIGVLDPIAREGGFYALMDGDEEIDPGYKVTVDSTNNTLETGAQNTVIVDIAVRLSPTAALIKAEIVKVPLAAAL